MPQDRSIRCRLGRALSWRDLWLVPIRRETQRLDLLLDPSVLQTKNLGDGRTGQAVLVKPGDRIRMVLPYTLMVIPHTLQVPLAVLLADREPDDRAGITTASRHSS